MEATAQANYVRYAPRRINQILTLIRNKPVILALKALQFVPRRGAMLVAKTIKSAAANAGDRQLKNPNLKVSAAWVGQGPTLKRMRAAAMGRGVTYKRKTCHLTVVVSETVTAKKGKV